MKIYKIGQMNVATHVRPIIGRITMKMELVTSIFVRGHFLLAKLLSHCQ